MSAWLECSGCPLAGVKAHTFGYPLIERRVLDSGNSFEDIWFAILINDHAHVAVLGVSSPLHGY